ncbi:hypothetical protein BN1002_00810 [Bacillus sp. B-jedd]|nr:hypothetical protein BN1002_00810 [Bacillus sp. B-jedd]
MNRKEKMVIRRQISTILETKCGRCVYRKGDSISICSKCPTGQQLQTISNKLWNGNRISAAPVNHNSKRRVWTEEEDLYLLNHKKYFSVDHIAEKLGRTVYAVNTRMTKLRRKRRQMKLAL